MNGQGADQQAAQEPHRPRAAADAGRAVLARKVDDLRQIGQHRDRDPGDAKQLKHVRPQSDCEGLCPPTPNDLGLPPRAGGPVVG